MKFYKCNTCGNIMAFLKGSEKHARCCGQELSELKANSTEAATEKHVPVVEVSGNLVNVCVGSVNHPMTEEHYIEWILVETNFGKQRKELKPGSEPKAQFALVEGEKVLNVYAYCNLHSLWVKEM